MRRGRVAGAVVLAAVVVFGLGGRPASADTASVGFSQEGTFWRAQPRAPVVDVPCEPNPPIPQDRCGKVSAGFPVSVVPDGDVAVAHAGGPTGADKGDQMWAVVEPDLLSVGSIGTVEKFTLTMIQAPDGRGDFGTPLIKACNIVAPFGSSEGTNPWDDRPSVDCNSAKAPKVDGERYTFELTDLAQSWLDGKGYGVAIVPGPVGPPPVVNSPEAISGVPPFQITFATSIKVGADGQPSPERPVALLEYNPGSDPLAGAGGGEDLGLDVGGLEVGGGDVGGLDLGSADDLGAVSSDAGAGGGGGDATTPGTAAGSRRISADRGFPLALLLLLPVGVVAFWSTGTALSALGDPVLPREGGVTRRLAHRRTGEG